MTIVVDKQGIVRYAVHGMSEDKPLISTQRHRGTEIFLFLCVSVTVLNLYMKAK